MLRDCILVLPTVYKIHFTHLSTLLVSSRFSLRKRYDLTNTMSSPLRLSLENYGMERT